MNAPRIFPAACALLTATALLMGCGHKEGDGHEQGKEVPAGASFKAGKGVSVTDETKQILGLKVADVAEENLPHTIPFTAQVYATTTAGVTPGTPAPPLPLRASGLLAPAAAALVRAGMTVQFTAPTGTATAGTVRTVHPALASGDAEIDAALPPTAAFTPGEFVRAVITVARPDAVTVIPRSALLRIAEGTFVYAVNGSAFVRTAVKVGAEGNDRVEITDGLLAGDAVVTHPVQTLWLIELLAVKGGGDPD